MQFACCFLGVAPPRPPMKEGLLSRPPGGPYPGRGGMAMHAPRPLLQPSPMAGGCVLMVYGLHEHKMNCDRVFNILCCYGNVLKVWKLPETFKVTCIQCNNVHTLYKVHNVGILIGLEPLVTRVGKICTMNVFCPSPPLCNVKKHFHLSDLTQFPFYHFAIL